MSTKPTRPDAEQSFWSLVKDPSKVSRFKVQMEFTEHLDGERYWRHAWTKAKSPDRVSPRTLARHRDTAIAFCHAETATKKKTALVFDTHDTYLAQKSRLYNTNQRGGGCLVRAEDTAMSKTGPTYALNVGDDALPSEGAGSSESERERKTDKESKRSGARKLESNSDSKGSQATCVAS
jgi:hypothetical protein